MNSHTQMNTSTQPPTCILYKRRQPQNKIISLTTSTIHTSSYTNKEKYNKRKEKRKKNKITNQ